jgi:alpha-galactosidase
MSPYCKSSQTFEGKTKTRTEPRPPAPRITTSTSPQSFSLSNPYLSYIFHVGPDGDLVHDHFGSFTEQVPPTVPLTDGGWGTVLSRSARELGDLGRGDFRIPTLVVRKPGGNRTLGLKYESYESFPGKKKLPGLPATFGSESEVSTLIVQLRDPLSDIRVKLSYSIFHQHPALARSMEVINESSEEVVIERADSWGVDLPSEEWEMRQLSGDWAREMGLVKRPVEIGTQGSVRVIPSTTL